jgi:hypothetical protein
LEIQVRTNLGAFFTLTPRQALTPAPSAVFSLGPWVSSGNDLSYTAGKVGIGTTNPGSVLGTKLEVAGGNVVVSHDFGFVSKNTAGTGIGAGIDTGQLDDLRLIAGGEPRVRITSLGAVGIGLFDELGGPDAGLHIRYPTDSFFGTLMLEGTPLAPPSSQLAFLTIFPHGTTSGTKAGFGYLSPGTSDLTIANAGGGRIVLSDAGGTHLPTCGEESLRIVRGSIIANAPDSGSGFTVTHLETGHYKVTFNTPFASRPTLTATQNSGSGTFAFAIVDATTVSSAEIYFFRPTGPELLDTGFNFIAVGPR